MTFRQAWIEALRRAVSPEYFLEQERKRSPDDMQIIDRKLELRTGTTEEQFISELAEIFKSKTKTRAFAAWLEWEKDRDNRKN